MQVFDSREVNVALGKAVFSTSNCDPAVWPNSMLVDSLLPPDNDNFACVSAGLGQYLQIDLNQTYPIARIRVFNRNGSGQGLAVNLSVTLFDAELKIVKEYAPIPNILAVYKFEQGVEVYCDLSSASVSGVVHTVYPCMNCQPQVSAIAPSSCDAVGMRMVVPRSEAHFKTMLAVLQGNYNVATQNLSSFFRVMPGVFKAASGNLDTCVGGISNSVACATIPAAFSDNRCPSGSACLWENHGCNSPPQQTITLTDGLAVAVPTSLLAGTSCMIVAAGWCGFLTAKNNITATVCAASFEFPSNMNDQIFSIVFTRWPDPASSWRALDGGKWWMRAAPTSFNSAVTARYVRVGFNNTCCVCFG